MSCRRHDRAGVSFASALAHDAGAITGGDGSRGGINRDHHDPGKLAHLAYGSDHILEHGECELLPPLGGEQRGKTLLGLHRVLDRHHHADFSRNTHVHAAVHTVTLARASAVASTSRASCSRSSSVVISVCAIVTGMPSAAAASASA